MTVINQFIRHKLAFKRRLMQLEFLKKCRDNYIIPKFLQIKKKDNFPMGTFSILKNAELKMLRCYIKTVRKELAEAELKLYYQHLFLAKSLQPDVMDGIMTRIVSYEEKEKVKITKTLERKFTDLSQVQNKACKLKTQHIDENFVNLSTYKPSKSEVEVLNKGPKFSQPKPLNFSNLICQVEKAMVNIPNKLKNSLRGYTAWHLSKYANIQDNQTNYQMKKQLDFNRTQKNLKNNSGINILCADKSNQFVLVDKVQYANKSKEVLENLKAVEVKRNPTNTLIKKICDLKNEFPAYRKYFEKTPIYATIPPMFFKVKIHKTNQPFRPIVNRRKSPIYNLEKYVSKLIEPIINNYTPAIKSSVEFLKDLKKVTVPKTARMFTFDVKALYPSIPMLKICQWIIEECGKNEEMKRHVPFITKAFKIISQANHFYINQKIFRQKKGAPMGSSLAAKLGEFAMQYIEKKIFTNRILKPAYYRRYVDDSFLLWEYTEKELRLFIEEFNSIIPEIQVILDCEKDNSIAFLDILLHRNPSDNTIWTEVFHKPSAPLDIVSSNTCTYKPYIENAIIPLIRRAYSHSTHEISKKKELNVIKNVMTQKGYLHKQYLKLLQKEKKTINSPNAPPKIQRKFIGSIQYHPATFAIKRMFHRLGYELAFNNTTLKQTITTDRDKPNLIGGVYSIPILHNNVKKTYIGQTRNNFEKRLYQHKYSLRSTYYNSAFKDFIWSNRSAIPLWNEAKVLQAPRDDMSLRIAEKIHICKNKGACINKNYDRDFNLLWHPLLSREKLVCKRK